MVPIAIATKIKPPVATAVAIVVPVAITINVFLTDSLEANDNIESLIPDIAFNTASLDANEYAISISLSPNPDPTAPIAPTVPSVNAADPIPTSVDVSKSSFSFNFLDSSSLSSFSFNFLDSSSLSSLGPPPP